ncbi:outer membrane lipoprotein chaperone LolA [Alteromonas gracilis]|uniref:outer membrane lipoprotein chaperone LolA n=1 Tax=Alteromonas gracilis TaxID=1479524 RepID=UPI003219F596
MKKAVSVFLLATLPALYGAAYANQTSTSVDGAIATEANNQVAAAENNIANTAEVALQSLLSDMKQFRADFAQTVVDADQNIVHEAQGVLTMTRPNKLRWETTFPDETLLIADGESVWNVDSFVEQVTVLSQSKAVEDNPIVLLTASDIATWNKFNIRKVDTSSVEGDDVAKQLSSFQVTPKELGGQISALTLTFNQNNELAALNMLDAQQQISTLVFKDIETRFPLAADTFTVAIPDSFIIDDQR